ncbi:hypothetical protein PRZ48_009136 [Zasmidium cellare]|uniref:Major facilitator superfamily (MFS) profile domain-containing protein n=1 Tax=Zasmidium cellare TaxID=395010 RepID=A0ABR0EBI3_ZASCE|nr:hypothetical protein PRZ48_009136 [Zasmidium cellare]
MSHPDGMDATPHASNRRREMQEPGQQEADVGRHVKHEKGAERSARPQLPTSETHPTSIQDGGLKAWLQVLGAWSVFFNTWGILNTFGVYQTYYETGELFTKTSSNISWIGSIQAALVLVLGLVSGPIYDCGYLRALLLLGSFLVVFGHEMLSLCQEFWQVVLAQGFAIGLGGGCLFVPAVAVLPTYFRRDIGLAMGVAASGSSIGGIVYPIVFSQLIRQVGFSWSVRILGFTALTMLALLIFLMEMRVEPSRVRAMVDWSAFKDWPYIVFAFGGMLGFAGLYVGLLFISYFGQATGIVDANLAFYLVPIMNAASVFGRTIPNWLSDKVGPLNVMIPGTFVVATLLFCNLAVRSVGGLVINTLLFGSFSGIFVGLPPVLFVALTDDKTLVGTRIGQGSAILALGVLAGGPGGGGILQSNGEHPDWTGMWIYAGVMMLGAGTTFAAVRFMKVGVSFQARV